MSGAGGAGGAGGASGAGPGVDALEIAASVRSGESSARHELEETLSRIATHDPELHAFISVCDEKVLEQADAVDRAVAQGRDPGPLAGIPIALKDNMCTRGWPTTCGSRILEGWRPPYDATAVERLHAAGALVVGKTNMDEFAMGSSTENSAFGPTRNPWDKQMVPGGSSGGSAAAVASGMVPLALGSDTGGSIRQPASLCGVVGMKPTYGGVSRFGLIAFASSLDQIGPFARTVREAATLYNAICGYDRRDSTSLPNAAAVDLGALDQGVRERRIGVVTELVDEMAPDVAAKVRYAADVLSDSGAQVLEVSIPEVRYGLSAYYLIAPAEASSNLARYDGVRYGLRVDAPDVATMNSATRAQGFGAEVKRRIMLGTYALSAGYYDAYYGQAQRVRTLLIRAMAGAYAEVDALLGATSPTTAFPLGARTQDLLAMYRSDTCTIPANLTGDPAMSVPVGTGEDGLPVGVQIMTPAFGEQLLFQAGRVLEDAVSGGRP